MKSIEEILEIATKRADERLKEISTSRLKYQKRVRNREKLKKKVK